MPKRRKRTPPKKIKQGVAFERVVAEVVRALDPGASVQQGVWVVGPDGRRELDVFIVGVVNGQTRSILVECKDFNPKSTGPVGISYIDALDSKRRDLGADAALICCNAGFTAEATNKAKRVGIGLIGVMRQGDNRIRFKVTEVLYTRQIKVEELVIQLRGSEPINLNGVPFEAVELNGVPVGNWVIQRAALLIDSNPIVEATIIAKHNLKQPIELNLPSGPVSVSGIDFQLRISGSWYSQPITIDSTGGVWDWLRRRVRMTPGPGQLHYEGVDIRGGTPIPAPPAAEISRDLRHGEMSLSLMLVQGMMPREPVPDIDSLVRPEDLDLIIADGE